MLRLLFLSLKEQKRLVVILIITFVIITPVGTLLHELGHVTIARSLGYNTELYYSSMNWSNDFKLDVLKVYEQNKSNIEKNLPFEGDFQYYQNVEKFNDDLVLILWGGIFQTVIFGSIGFVILLLRNLKGLSFTFIDWILVFITFFLSRELFNLIFGIVRGLFNFKGVFFFGDEARIAKHLDLAAGTIIIPLGIATAVILIYTVFYIIPYMYRLVFVVSGLVGSVLGYILWMIIFGPILLPE